MQRRQFFLVGSHRQQIMLSKAMRLYLMRYLLPVGRRDVVRLGFGRLMSPDS